MVSLRTQHASWARRRWIQHPSVLSQFAARPRPVDSSSGPRLFVTLGTIKPYRFDSLVDAVLATGLANESTVWQLGETTRSDLPGTVRTLTSDDEFRRYATEADVVVTHSGVGTILNLLEWGIHPVVVPRRRARGEHVDDHQSQIAALLGDLGIAVVAEAPDLVHGDLVFAARHENLERTPPPAQSAR
ncbi:glycosyltransferase [Microbacterium sp. 2P01SA-2]|uniref:glycosyltransferase n=1 Tax=unclassified Microbacterium TaxID=2609290 RepID=UPI0039A00DFF